jgi:hypothetical protein
LWRLLLDGGWLNSRTSGLLSTFQIFDSKYTFLSNSSKIDGWCFGGNYDSGVHWESWSSSKGTSGLLAALLLLEHLVLLLHDLVLVLKLLLEEHLLLLGSIKGGLDLLRTPKSAPSTSRGTWELTDSRLLLKSKQVLDLHLLLSMKLELLELLLKEH